MKKLLISVCSIILIIFSSSAHIYAYDKNDGQKQNLVDYEFNKNLQISNQSQNQTLTIIDDKEIPECIGDDKEIRHIAVQNYDYETTSYGKTQFLITDVSFGLLKLLMKRETFYAKGKLDIQGITHYSKSFSCGSNCQAQENEEKSFSHTQEGSIALAKDKTLIADFGHFTYLGGPNTRSVSRSFELRDGCHVLMFKKVQWRLGDTYLQYISK